MPATTDRYWMPADLAQFPEGDGQRYECIDGELLVTPAPRFDHGFAVHCLALALSETLGGMHRLFTHLLDFRLEQHAVVEPDMVVFSAPMSRRTRLDDPSHLSIVIEVLSPGTASRDRGSKRRFYQRVGIREYWIVDVDARRIERWHPGGEFPEIAHEWLEWTDDATGADCRIDVRSYFDEVLGSEPGE